MELIGEVLFVDKVLENELHHGGTADVAVAHEKYSNAHNFSFQKALSCCHLQRFARC